MFNVYRLISISLFVLLIFVAALAQERAIEMPRDAIASEPLVSATATAKRVRFVSPGTVVQLRLEIYNEVGQKLFDTELRGGNVLDWHLQDGAGQPMTPGSYTCVLTTKSLSGRLTQRIGLVAINDQGATIANVSVDRLSRSLQHTIGPVESNTGFKISGAKEINAVTATHDGSHGQLTSTTGALTFRTGDIFLGKDVERVRITPEGNVGIGTDKPAATLDVAGAVRATEGFRFSDGTTLDATGGKVTLRDADGDTLPGPSAAGTGTQNKLAKWAETGGAGTLTDSAVTDQNGNIGIDVASPTQKLDVAGNTKFVGPAGSWVLGTAHHLFVSQDGAAVGFQNTGADGGSGAQMFDNNGALRAAFQWLNPNAVNGNSFNIAVIGADPITFANNTSQVRMTIAGNGNVGVGTSSPSAKLDVAGSINTSSQYNLGGSHVLSSAGVGNLFAGKDAGKVNTGIFNSFFGVSTGSSNTSGTFNSFFGSTAGGSNTQGSFNSFFGMGSGNGNTTGNSNSFFGLNAGTLNSTGSNNSIFGASAGNSNTSGTDNALFGFEAGRNVNSFRNAIFGKGAGSGNNIGNDNSFFGTNAGQNSSGGSNVFVGISAGQNSSGNNNSFVGREAGRNNTGTNNTFVGRSAGVNNTSGSSNVFIGTNSADGNTGGNNNTVIGAGADLVGVTSEQSFQTVIGAGARSFRSSNAVTIGRSDDDVFIPGTVFIHDTNSVTSSEMLRVNGRATFNGTSDFEEVVNFRDEVIFRNLVSLSTQHLCVNQSGEVFGCSSSLRYKTDIRPFSSGLNLVNRLQPILFSWKKSGEHDLGLAAEDVAKVEPLLATYNSKGQVQGVKYERIAVVLLNAVKEQQGLIVQQQHEIDALRKLVCQKNRRARACR